LSYLPRIQKEDGTKTNPTFGINHNESCQSHISPEPTFAIIILKSTFVPKLQPSPIIPTQLLQISLAILPAIQLHGTCKPNPYTIANNHLSSTTFANNIPNSKLTNIPTKSRAKQSTFTYCYHRMPKGLKNAGSTFCRMMKVILREQLERNVFAFVDDIVVASRKKETLLQNLVETFTNM
jgi:hypothetical protein